MSHASALPWGPRRTPWEPKAFDVTRVIHPLGPPLDALGAKRDDVTRVIPPLPPEAPCNPKGVLEAPAGDVTRVIPPLGPAQGALGAQWGSMSHASSLPWAPPRTH